MRSIVAALLLLIATAVDAGTLGGGTHNSNTDYASFIVFGDMQRMMNDYRQNGGASAPDYAELDAAVDWIFENRDRERIGFVMAVGDLINSAVALPPTGDEVGACDFENGAPYTSSSAVCIAYVADETNCKATSGCFWKYDSDGDGESCGSCDLVARAETEWTGFDALWARFAPGGDTTDGIPALLVRGNHDNVGTQNAVDTDREPLGWNDRYDESYWVSLNDSYGKRFYRHVSSYTDSTTGNNYAWFVKLAGRQILVVSIACCITTGIPDDAEDWALSVMALYPSIPSIVLTHHANAIETIVVNSADSEAPNLFAYFGGHDNDRLKTVRTIGAKEIIRSETDWTNDSVSSQNDFFTVVRVWFNSGEVEVFDYSHAGDIVDPTSGNRLVKQAFSTDPL